MNRVLLLLLVLPLVGCLKEATPVQVEGAIDNFEVTRLFTKDGCTVYRFRDISTHYFTNCSAVISSHEENCGKNCWRTVDDTVPTGRPQ